MIGIVDVGGNTLSVLRAVEAVTDEPVLRFAGVPACDALIVPGQGSFGSHPIGMRGAIYDHIGAGKPYLGICLGLQILYDGSDEAPGVPGLGILRGTVRKLKGRVPRMGYEEVPGVGRCYFCHSFSAGVDLVRQGNITGTQWHPEKSGEDGLKFLRGWVNG